MYHYLVPLANALRRFNAYARRNPSDLDIPGAMFKVHARGFSSTLRLSLADVAPFCSRGCVWKDDKTVQSLIRTRSSPARPTRLIRLPANFSVKPQDTTALTFCTLKSFHPPPLRRSNPDLTGTTKPFLPLSQARAVFGGRRGESRSYLQPFRGP